MDVLFRFLGLAAWINAGTSRFRINFIPFNWIIIIGLFIGFTSAYHGMVEAFADGKTPQQVKLSEVLAHSETIRNYIVVSGEFHHEDTIVFAANDAKEYERYIPLTEFGSNRAILVRVNPPDVDGVMDGVETEQLEDDAHVRVTGLLRPINDGHVDALQKHRFKLGELTIDREYELVTAMQPSSPGTTAIPTVLLGIGFLAMVATLLMRYVVFRSTREPLLTLAEKMHGMLSVTGEFILPEQNTSQRFLNVPAVPLQSEEGALLFISNIDASSRFFGFKTNNLHGYWALYMQPTDLRPVPGRLYLGLFARPALRVAYRDLENKPATAIFSFTSQEDRARMAGWLLMTPEQRNAFTQDEESTAVNDATLSAEPAIPDSSSDSLTADSPSGQQC